MCGIAGWVNYGYDLRLQKEVVERMNQQHSVRGPDAEGIWLGNHVALAHRRLSIIDPEGGAQPMVKYVDGRKYVITYNGEIYNMPELQAKLQTLGYSLDTRSDTELILTAYIHWKDQCIHYLNGIFAFAIWDEFRQELFLARDRIGVKPLFYFQKDSTFLFGSEIKSLLVHPLVEPILDEEGLAEILVMGPARTPGVGVFCGIKECKPGHFIRVCRDQVIQKPYWRLTSQSHRDDFETTVEKVRELFIQAVQRQLVSDVPIGTMLSGGLDSSAISACAAQVFAQEGRAPLPTFSVDYVDNDKYFATNEFQPNSDAPWVKRMVQHIHSNHHTIYVDNQELLDSIIPAMRARDLPGMADIDASLMLFSRDIKKVCTVVLSGECADEVFGGYPWFHRKEMVNAETFPWARLVSQRLPFIRSDIATRIRPLEYVEARYQEALAEVPRHAEDDSYETKMRELFYLNLTRWMPTLLDRKDRMSMAYGLEVRVPFCDHHLVEYVWNIPWSMKAYGGREKGLLRYALKGILPDEIIERKKSPYPKTHHPDYLRTMQKEILKLTEDPKSPLFQLLDHQVVKGFAEQDLSQKHFPWFGQLMNVPALLAYWLQLNEWLKEYQVIIR
ncbi:asparagine synthase (glutamine-hydrolyzing) [Thermoflavimicrobium daqui]|uniref:asparagine synthase (glutamine-hydrolyzing) n=1 Tax=Thermoflavimicrobium daqui TaxID=2137476 RepID=A0A364K3N6_9BACL|nr:asparagine synthase (glutamine-hydrolyzing) [Thermoflavimicrobium daqui]RAL23433.1 asparagine synthase (glutamine-hydrolyzing) [Thermoflavimicrobium daqui]